jgi:hypothetical protein
MISLELPHWSTFPCATTWPQAGSERDRQHPPRRMTAVIVQARRGLSHALMAVIGRVLHPRGRRACRTSAACRRATSPSLRASARRSGSGSGLGQRRHRNVVHVERGHRVAARGGVDAHPEDRCAERDRPDPDPAGDRDGGCKCTDGRRRGQGDHPDQCQPAGDTPVHRGEPTPCTGRRRSRRCTPASWTAAGRDASTRG